MHTVIHCLSVLVIVIALVFAGSSANRRNALQRQVRELQEAQASLEERHAQAVEGLQHEVNTRSRRINEDVARTEKLIEEKQAAVKAKRLMELQLKAYADRDAQLDAVLKICVIRADWKDIKVLADRGEFIKEERDADGAIGLKHRSGLWVTTYPPEGADTGGLVRAKSTAR